MPLSTGIVEGEVLSTPISGTFLAVLVIVTVVVAVLAMPVMKRLSLRAARLHSA